MREDHSTNYSETEELHAVILELRERSLSQPIIVEGMKDVVSLRELGVEGHIIHLNLGNPLIDLCTDIGRKFSEAVILTDWDRKGNTLCLLLKKNLKACDVAFDTRLRARLAAILRRDVKDVESIAAFLRHHHPDVYELITDMNIIGEAEVGA